MTISTALILAAGRGSRPGEQATTIPKGLVEIGGETLVSRSVRQLHSRGVNDVVIVTGFRDDLYQAFAAGRSGVRCVHNSRFDQLGSLESLRCGLQVVRAPLLVLDSDVIYESRGLDALLGEPAENAALVSGPSGSGDEYYVWANARRSLYHFSKRLEDQPVAPLGEHVGIIKIGTGLMVALRDGAPGRLEDNPMAYYESLLVRLLATHGMTAVHVRDLLWSEIDTADMLETARNRIWPRLKAKGDN